ncbi:hypothetical protein [Pseudomonas sp. LF245]
MTDAQYDLEMADLSQARNGVLMMLTGHMLSRFPTNPLAPWTPGVLA